MQKGNSLADELSPVFMHNFKMIHDFELIQNWRGSDLPFPALGKSLMGSKSFIAIGIKQNETYLIIREEIGMAIHYFYLEKSSIEKLKKILEDIKVFS